MSGLIRRAAPGLAIAGAALSVVWLFDPALHPGATRAAPDTSQSAADESDGGSDPGSGGDSGSGSGADTGSGSGADTGSDAGADTGADTGNDSGGAGSGTDSGSSTGADGGSGTEGESDGESSPSASSDPGADSGSATTTASDCTGHTEAVVGDSVMTRWGDVQVQVEFAADGSVCDVHAIAYPENDPHSARLNATAVPSLDARACEVGVTFDAVSGATYTSEAYRASLQSILDQR